LRRRVPDDHHRAAGVIDTVLADRAEQPAYEISMTVAAHDEQLGVAGRLHEHMAGLPGATRLVTWDRWSGPSASSIAV